MRLAYILSGISVIYCIYCSSVFSKEPNAVLSKEIAVGQIWKYDARPHESKSTLTIVQIDDNVIHVSVSGLMVKDPDADDGIAESIRHLPLDISAFNKSKTKLVGAVDKLPEFEEGLSDWVKARNKGIAKPITIPVKEVISQVEIMINQ